MKKLSKKMMIFKFKTDFKIKNYKILYKIKISKRSKKLKKFKKSKKLKKLKKIKKLKKLKLKINFCKGLKISRKIWEKQLI